MYKKILMAFSIGILTSSALAADACNPCWTVDVAPYFWAINMSGTVVNGPFRSRVNEDFAKIMSQFDGGGMLFADVHKGPFGLFFNGLYTVLSDHGNIRRLDLHVKTRYGLYAAGVSYILWQRCFENIGQFQIEPYAGARYTLNDVRLKIDDFTLNNNKSWTDPILGARLSYQMNRCWQALFAGDIGGTSITKHSSYNLIGLVGFKPVQWPCATWYLGYRSLYQNYQTGSGLRFYQWKMHLFGPVLGVNFSIG